MKFRNGLNEFLLKINRLLPQEDDTTHFLVLQPDALSSIETAIRNLHHLAKTFQEICSSLTTQILMLSGRSFLDNQNHNDLFFITQMPMIASVHKN